MRGFDSPQPARRSVGYLVYWIAVRVVAYPLVLLWFIAYSDSRDVLALLIVWLLFSSVFHAAQLPALVRFHWRRPAWHANVRTPQPSAQCTIATIN